MLCHCLIVTSSDSLFELDYIFNLQVEKEKVPVEEHSR